MLLAAAYGALGLNIEPDVVFNLPIVKKRGRPYAVDCLVAEYSEEENCSNTNDSMEERTNWTGKPLKWLWKSKNQLEIPYCCWNRQI